MRQAVLTVQVLFLLAIPLGAIAQAPQADPGVLSPLLAPEPSPPPADPSSLPQTGAHPKGGGSPAFSLLFEMSVSPDPAMRMRALEAWGDSDSQEALMQVMNGLLDQDGRVREIAVNELSGFGAKRVFDYVMGLLIEGEAYTIGVLSSALPMLKNQLEDRFLEVFTDEGVEVPYRRAAAYALGRMGSQQASELLAQNAWSENLEFAYTCAEALYNVRDSSALNAWRSLLGHDVPGIRRYAVYGICTNGSLNALAMLREICLQQIPLDPEFQVEAARCINSWPAENAIPVLIEAMAANRNVGPACAQQLSERTGLDFGENPELWLSWWQELTTPPSEPASPPEE